MNVIHRQGVPWPHTKPRTATRMYSRFGNTKEPTLLQSCGRVEKQVSAFTRNGRSWRTQELCIWADCPTLKEGRFRADRNIHDPGVVVTFDLDKRTVTIACDHYTTAAGNLCAVAAYIEGLRAQERHGVASIDEILAGHMALPARSSALAKGWWDVLHVDPEATIEEIEAARRRLAKALHPDAGGTNEAMAELNLAYEEARRARGLA